MEKPKRRSKKNEKRTDEVMRTKRGMNSLATWCKQVEKREKERERERIKKSYY